MHVITCRSIYDDIDCRPLVIALVMGCPKASGVQDVPVLSRRLQCAGSFAADSKQNADVCEASL